MAQENKKRGKWPWILLAVFLIFGAGIFYIYLSFFGAGPLAVLSIDSGEAMYKSGGDWQKASSGMTLKQGDGVKTLESSSAKIIFSDSVMRLDSGTEISINNLQADRVSLSQAAGRTWTRLLKISGIKQYDIETKDALATVRGTGFSVESGEATEIKVVEGNVAVNSGKEEKTVGADEELDVKKDETGLSTKALEKDDWVAGNVRLDEEHVKEIKSRLIKKYGFLISRAQSAYGATDEDVEKAIDQWLDGQISVKDAIKNGQIPGGLESLIPAELKRY